MVFDPFAVQISEQMREDSKLRHLHYGKAFRNAEIEGGKGRIWGSLGEIVVGSVIGNLGATETLNFDYDLTWNDKTWDIKTKTRKDLPMADWDAAINASAMHQKTDYYIFVSIVSKKNLLLSEEQEILDFPYELAYIMGYISKNEFLMEANLRLGGSIDPQNGIVYRGDTYTIRYDKLHPFRELLPEEKKGKARPKVFAKFR